MNILYLLIIIPVAFIVLSIIFMMRPNSMEKTMEKMMERAINVDIKKQK